MKKSRPKILCICAKGMNRSRYLSKYLRGKGYSTKFGGVEPYEKPEYKWNPISQKKIDWAEIIIIIRKRLNPILRKKFKTRSKKTIVLDVTDSPRQIPKKFKHLRELNHREFNKKWTYPQLRKAIKSYLPLVKTFEIKKYSVLPKKIKIQADKIEHDCFYAGWSKKRLKENKDRFYNKPYVCFLAIEKESIISVIKLYKRTIKYRDKKIIFGGIGGICTIKRERKKGIASVLLKKGIEDLRKQKCDVAFLCTDVKNPKRVRLYGKFGFIVMKQPYTYIRKSGKRHTEKAGMIAPIRSKAKFNLIFKGKEPFDVGYGGL